MSKIINILYVSGRSQEVIDKEKEQENEWKKEYPIVLKYLEKQLLDCQDITQLSDECKESILTKYKLTINLLKFSESEYEDQFIKLSARSENEDDIVTHKDIYTSKYWQAMRMDVGLPLHKEVSLEQKVLELIHMGFQPKSDVIVSGNTLIQTMVKYD